MSYVEGNGNPFTMNVVPAGSGMGMMGGLGGFGYGGMDILTLVVILALFGRGGWGGNGGGSDALPLMMAMQNGNGNSGYTDATVQRGFDQAAVTSGINSILATLSSIQQAQCSGNAALTSTMNNGFALAEASANARQMSAVDRDYNTLIAMNQGFNNVGQRFDDCCCENRVGLANLTSTILQENCADRAEVSNGVRDVLAAINASTQRIIDQNCQYDIDRKNEKINEQASKIAALENQAYLTNVIRQAMGGNGCGCGNNYGCCNG